jgi:acyl-CoA dehydrogenase
MDKPSITLERSMDARDNCFTGGQGMTAETSMMRIFMDIRAFRAYDGPSELHRWSMARKLVYLAQKAAQA